MKLNYRNVPADVNNAMNSGLNRMVQNKNFGNTHFARAIPAGGQPSQVKPIVTLPLFTLGLSDFKKDDPLGNVVQIGWRSLIGNGNDVFAAGDVQTDGTSQPILSQINTGPFVGGLQKAIKHATENSKRNQRTYEVCVLVIPALYIMALWLRADTDSGLIVPIAPAPEFLSPDSPITESEFLDAAVPVAKRTLNAHDKVDAQGGSVR